jgi:tetratricopeptide (TPR) repeat protein
MSHRPALLFNRAQALRRAGGHAEEAIALYERFLEESPGSAREKDAVAHIAELRGPSPSGDEAKDQGEAKTLYERGAKAFDAGEYMVAADLFAQADKMSHRPALCFNRAQALRKAGGHAEEAMALYRQYLEESPGGPSAKEAAQHLAEMAPPERSGDPQKDEERAKALFDQAAKAYAAGQFMVAADLFAQADSLSHYPEIVFSRAQCLRRAGGHAEEAIALYEQYLSEAAGGGRAAEARDFIVELRGPVPSANRSATPAD